MSVAALVMAASVALPGGPAALDARLAPQEVTVGDRVEVTLTVTAPAGELLGAPSLPAPLERWGAAEVLAREDLGREVDGSGNAIFRWRLELAAFRTGRVDLPPLPVELPVAEPVSLATPADLGFTVVSVLPAEGEIAPSPPAPLVPLPLGSAFWAALAVGLLLLAAAGAALWRRGGASSSSPAVAPADRLRRELATLSPHDAPEAAVAGASLALRRYLAARLGVPAPERTTTEIARGLPATGLPAELGRRIVTLLRRCDGVKFARAGADAATAAAVVAEAGAVGEAVERAVAPPPAEEAA